MHLSVAETFPRRKMEVSDDLVDADSTFNPAAFAALLVELLSVVFALALIDVFAAPEGPGGSGVGVADFGAGIAAAGLRSGRGCIGAVAAAAIGRVQVVGFIRMSVLKLSFTVELRNREGSQIYGFAVDCLPAFIYVS